MASSPLSCSRCATWTRLVSIRGAAGHAGQGKEGHCRETGGTCCTPPTGPPPPISIAVAVVLGFVGGKILADFVGYSVSTEVSLGVVAGVLALGVVASVLSPEQADQEKDA